MKRPLRTLVPCGPPVKGVRPITADARWQRARASLLALASLSYTSNRPLCSTLTESAEGIGAKLLCVSFLDSPLASACGWWKTP